MLSEQSSVAEEHAKVGGVLVIEARVPTRIHHVHDVFPRQEAKPLLPASRLGVCGRNETVTTKCGHALVAKILLCLVDVKPAPSHAVHPGGDQDAEEPGEATVPDLDVAD